MTICFTAKLCLRMMARTASTSSPGSMTMASREGLIADDRAVALQRPNGKDFVNHWKTRAQASGEQPLKI